MSRFQHMLYVVAPDKMYWQIRFSDLAPEYILGGVCFACARKGPVDRVLVEKRWGSDSQLRHVDGYLRCRGCGNRGENRFTVYGRRSVARP